MTPYKFVQKVLKNQFSTGGSGGAKIVKNRPRGTGTPKTEFFEILHFSTKEPHFSTPKIDPKKRPKCKNQTPQIASA
jgi:hypothetical protein